MATVTYGFEGGTNGNTVAAGAGAGAGDTNFDAVSNTSSTDIYDTTHAAHGTQAVKIATTTATLSYNAWTTSIGTQTTTWVRAYLYLTAAPAANTRLISFVGSAASRGNCLAAPAGTLLFTDSTGGIQLTSAAVPLNAWFRIEAAFTGSATVGQWEYKIWNTPDSSGTPSDTQITAATLNTGGTTDSYRFGVSAALASVGPYWMDDLGVSTAGYIGPAGGGVVNLPVLGSGPRPAAAAVRLLPPRVITGPVSGQVTSGPRYATAAADLGGGSGSWVSPANADGAPDSTYATWTSP